MEVLPCANPSVLAYMRSGEVADILTSAAGAAPAGRARPSTAPLGLGPHRPCMARTVPAGNESAGDEVVHRYQAVLCVHNLSRFAQPAELALAKWAGLDALRGAGAGARSPSSPRSRTPSRCRRTASCGSTWCPRRGRRRNERRARPGAAHAGRGVAGACGGPTPPATIDHRARPRCCAPGRPGLLDIVADVADGRAHVVVGPARRRRRAAFPARRRGGGARPPRGRGRPGRVHRRAARRAAGAAAAGHGPAASSPRPGPVAVVRDDDEATVLDCGDRGDLIGLPVARATRRGPTST